MHNRFEKLIRCALFVALGSLTYLGGCGPQDLNDPGYLAQTKEETAKNAFFKRTLDDQDEPDAAEAEPGMKGDVEEAPAAQEPEEGKEEMKAMPTAPEPEEKADEEPAAEGKGGMPSGMPNMPKADMPTADMPRAEMPALAVPTAVVQGPTSYVRLPSVVRNRPPVIINTKENRNFEREVHFLRKIHVLEPEITRHLIENDRHVTNRYFTKIIHHPTTRTDVRSINVDTRSDVVMPTTEITMPTQEIVMPVYEYPSYGYAAYPYPYIGRGYLGGFGRFGGFRGHHHRFRR